MAIETILKALNLSDAIVIRSTRHVLIELSSYADSNEGSKKNTCFPGIAILAKKTGYAEGTVKRAINNLVKQGYVTKQRRFNTSNIYKITIPNSKKYVDYAKYL